jgi:hypothetical protein
MRKLIVVVLALTLVCAVVAGQVFAGQGNQVGARQQRTRGDSDPQGPGYRPGPGPQDGSSTNPQGCQEQDRERDRAQEQDESQD